MEFLLEDQVCPPWIWDAGFLPPPGMSIGQKTERQVTPVTKPFPNSQEGNSVSEKPRLTPPEKIKSECGRNTQINSDVNRRKSIFQTDHYLLFSISPKSFYSLCNAAFEWSCKTTKSINVSSDLLLMLNSYTVLLLTL